MATQKAAATAIGLLGAALALWRLHGHYPLQHWLVLRYAPIWLACLLWAGACLAAGDALARRILGRRLPLGEHLVVSLALGVLAFALGVFLVGIAGGLGPAAFLLLPAALAAAGGPGLYLWLRRVLHLITLARHRPGPRPSPLALAVVASGALGVAILYFNILTPGNAAYDAHWYHVALAEHYGAAGRIARFPEGWFPGAVPQLASHLYTWAFIAPGADLWTRIELAAHLEFTLFLATLAAIPVLARRLAGGARVPRAWVALLLFPGIFVYDSSPSLAADHVAAFWAVPIALAAARVLRAWRQRDAVLLGACGAAALLTKYQAAYLLAGPALALCVRAAVLAVRARSPRALAVPAAGLVTFVLCTSPHWLKNALWYGDPLYPLLHAVFPGQPWNPSADTTVTMQPPGWAPTGSLPTRLGESLLALATFAWKPHDWPAFHRDWPVFGFLFMLSLPYLLIVRGGRALRALAGATLAGIFLWYFTYHQDRYLQILVPWMAAVLAVVIRHVWRLGVLPRAALAALIGVQVVWAADLPFLPTHAMVGQPQRLSAELLAGGYQGRHAERFKTHTDLEAAGRALPPGATVLVHETHLRLGLGARAVSDARGTQGALSYALARSPRDLWEKLRAMGVTHVLWPASGGGGERWADEVVFHDFVLRAVSAPQGHGGYMVGALGPAPAETPYGPAVVIGCRGLRRVPVAELDAAVGSPGGPVGPDTLPPALAGASFALVEAACRSGVIVDALPGWRHVASRHGHEIRVRP